MTAASLRTGEAALLESVPTELFIGGAWVPASDGGTLDVVDPATGQLLRTVSSASVDDGLAALDAAVTAQSEWGTTPPRVRGELLRRAWELLMERREDFALLVTPGRGKPVAGGP